MTLNLPVAGIAALIKHSPVVIVITLVLVIPAIRPTVLDITIPSYVVPFIPSYLIGQSVILDKNPRSAVIIRAVPVTIMEDVISVSIVNDIIRTAYGY